MLEIYEIGDMITLKKAHPCGSYQWTVVRIGAEIGLECLTCKHRILLSRHDLRKKLKRAPEKRSEPRAQQEE